MKDEPKNLFLELGEQEYRLWTHNPITAAYLQFIDDQITNWRGLAADCVESGFFRLASPHEDANPDVVRGKMLALRMLRGISLEHIQAFYGQEPPEEVSQENQAHEPPGTADQSG